MTRTKRDCVKAKEAQANLDRQEVDAAVVLKKKLADKKKRSRTPKPLLKQNRGLTTSGKKKTAGAAGKEDLKVQPPANKRRKKWNSNIQSQ